MKSTFILILKVLATLAVAMILNTLTGALLTPLTGAVPSGPEMPSMGRIFRGLVTMHLIQILILSLLALKAAPGRFRLGVLLSILSFTINHLLNTMESLIYMYRVYPVSQQMVSLLSGLILSVGIGFTVAFLLGRPGEESYEKPRFQWTWKLVPSWAGWSLLWFVIYFTAGLLIPMNAAGVSEYYFSGLGAMDLSMVPFGYLMQVPRASLWILLTIGIGRYLKGADLEKSLITGLTFGVLMSSSLLVPNPLMPDIVRLSHLPEILYANILWGMILSLRVAKHISPPVGTEDDPARKEVQEIV